MQAAALLDRTPRVRIGPLLKVFKCRTMDSLSAADLTFQDPRLTTGSEAEQNMPTSTEPACEDDEACDTRQTETPFEEYDPYSFSKEMERLDGMQKSLEGVRQTFNENSMKSLLLNADVVTMFDPVSSEEIKSIVMDCKHCADRIAEMQSINEPKRDSVTHPSFDSADGNTLLREDKKSTSEQNVDKQASNSGNESLMETDVEPVVRSTLTTRAVEGGGSVCVFDQPPNED